MPEPTNAVRQPASRHSAFRGRSARAGPPGGPANPGDPGPQPLYHDSVKTCITYSTALYEVPVPDPDPLDPFGFEEDNESEPIDDEERAALLEDLADLAEFREALEPRGFRGVVIPCPDCEEDHYFSWSLLRENLEHILERG